MGEKEELLPCPFCGKRADLSDGDTLYPSGTGWRDDATLGMRTYLSFRDVPKEQWCYTMHCPTTSGGCGAEMSGDSEAEAITKWNRRAAIPSDSAQASMEAILLAGNGLSNAAYNLSQFDVIAADYRAKLRNAAKKWDDALAAHKQEPTK